MNRTANALRLSKLAIALIPTFVFAMFMADASVGATLRIEAAVLFIAAAARPTSGLILIALLAPLGDVIVPLLGAAPHRHAETQVVAFLAGWLLRAAVENAPLLTEPRSLVNAMWLFAATLLASVATSAMQLHRLNVSVADRTLNDLVHAYVSTEDIVGVHTAASLLEGIGLVVAVASIARRATQKQWLLGALVCGAVFAACATALLAIGIAPVGTLARQMGVGVPRYSATVRDLNAAASYYLLLLGVAAGLAVSFRRTRVLWTLGCLVVIYGVTLTQSRSAAVAGSIVTVAAGTLWIVRGTTRRAQYLVAIPIAVVALAAAYAANSPGAGSSLEMRGGFAVASVHMIRTRPLFGVGVGRYYSLSRLVLPPALASAYGLENAHDYFLQLTAELGVIGAICFVSILAAVIGRSLLRLWRREGDAVEGGCVAGAIAYLTTCVTGHPFLVPEAAVPFWLVLGVLAGVAGIPATVQARHGGFTRLWPMAVGCLLLLTAPFRPDAPRLRLQPGEDGFGAWQSDERGTPFRETRAFASVFVEPNVRAIEIPMKLGAGQPAGSATAAVQVVVPGAFQREVRVERGWSTIFVDLPGAEPLVPRQRINLSVASAVDVGQIKIIAAQ
jgi:hypothetical protein